ncbi:MAG: amidohydrolase family protein [Planctomycetaceae bacterium]
MNDQPRTRRDFLTRGAHAAGALGLSGTIAQAAGFATDPATAAPPADDERPLVIDGMMHLEVVGKHWEGLIDEVLAHYEAAKIDKGVILTTWMPTKKSNDRTLAAYEKHPDRFIPFGHIRPQDDEWESELKRIAQPPWKGLKLLHGEFARHAGDDLQGTVRRMFDKIAEVGIKVVKIHLQVPEIVEELTRAFPKIMFIFPHLGAWNEPRNTHTKAFCELARGRENVYLDTSGFASYWDMAKWIREAGVEKVTFASDGFLCSPLVEKAKVESLALPTQDRTPPFTRDELALVLGGNMARILGIDAKTERGRRSSAERTGTKPAG